MPVPALAARPVTSRREPVVSMSPADGLTNGLQELPRDLYAAKVQGRQPWADHMRICARESSCRYGAGPNIGRQVTTTA